MSMDRRRFLTVVGGAALGIAGCGPSGKTPQPATQTVSLAFADFPSLATIGGGVAFPNNLPIVVVRISDNQAVALAGVCTHAQCPLSYTEGSLVVTCGCHGALFNVNGQPVRGPATQVLAQYAATVEQTAVVVTL
jgi:Rieske Fe-S protein